MRGPDRLPGRTAAVVAEFITGPLRDNHNRLRKPLSHELAGMRTARRGDYRVPFSLDEGARAIHIHRIDHRSDVYRHRRPTAPSDQSRQLRKKEPHD